MFLPMLLVPPFPGAMNKFLHILLLDIFQAMACSLPPDPNNRIFIFKNII